jgi:hypothetical protein
MFERIQNSVKMRSLGPFAPGCGIVRPRGQAAQALDQAGESTDERGAVTDFMSLGVGPLRSGIFNLADLWIGFGVGVLVWSLRAPAGKPGPATP